MRMRTPPSICICTRHTPTRADSHTCLCACMDAGRRRAHPSHPAPLDPPAKPRDAYAPCRARFCGATGRAPKAAPSCIRSHAAHVPHSMCITMHDRAACHRRDTDIHMHRPHACTGYAQVPCMHAQVRVPNEPVPVFSAHQSTPAGTNEESERQGAPSTSAPGGQPIEWLPSTSARDALRTSPAPSDLDHGLLAHASVLDPHSHRTPLGTRLGTAHYEFVHDLKLQNVSLLHGVRASAC